MSLIVAARFTTFEQAQRAAKTLFAENFAQDDVSVFFVNAPGQHSTFHLGGDRDADPNARKAHRASGTGIAFGACLGAVVGGGIITLTGVHPLAAILAAGVGAYVGSLIGALNGMRRQAHDPLTEVGKNQDIRHAGVLLAVHVRRDNEDLARRLLADAGGDDVERASGQWKDGNWVDFDPVKAPQTSFRNDAAQGGDANLSLIAREVFISGSSSASTARQASTFPQTR